MYTFKHSSKLMFSCLSSVLFTLILMSGCGTDHPGDVSVYEEEIGIPTYPAGAPELNPMFFRPDNYQGEQRWIYPYPNIDSLSGDRVSKTYKALFLENKYVKLSVLPELGGRLYMARDKSNEYDFIYYNRVIKPALIGIAGAWLSGGMAWNNVHHHRVSTFMPVDYKLVENDDGSKTIWVGEYEKRHHTRWVVGMTLYHDRSYVKTDVRLFNTTPLIISSLLWANAAMHTNENYQFIFPPDEEVLTYHYKNDFTDWPVADQFFRGHDFRGGVDISMWKNSHSPLSLFTYESDQDFLAGIDHGKKAGTIFVGEHHVWKGRKLWSWGNGEVQRLWDKKLTDEDGPYIELMMGTYSDNQPDYSWNNPFSARKSAMVFYPLREMSNVKEANEDLSLNLELDHNMAIVEINATIALDHCRMLLKDQDNLLYEQEFSIDPGQPVEASIKIPEISSPYNIEILIVNEKDEELISYTPYKKQNPEHPPVFDPTLDPDELETTEELFLTGLRLEQFSNPFLDPEVYWKEALKKDSGDSRINTRLGIRALKNHKYAEASEHLQKAINRVTSNYTKPLDGNPLYYLGLCRYYQSDLDEAYDLLYKATWNDEWNSASYFLLALIDCMNGDLQKATEHAGRSVQSDNNNLEAWQLYAILLRESGDKQGALDAVRKTLELDPINFVAHYEMHQHGKKFSEDELVDLLRSDVDNYLELSARYLQAGFNKDAAGILELALESGDRVLSESPMIHYYLGYAHKMLNESGEMSAFYSKGSNLKTDYCFPHGYMSEKVLLDVINERPDDPLSLYYLGNLYADFRPEKSLELWRRSARLDQDNAICHRNIAFISANRFDGMEDAVREMEYALKINPKDPLYYTEADSYAEYLGKPVGERLERMQGNTGTVLHSDVATVRLIKLLILNRKYDEALDILTKRHFHAAEASDIIVHNQWTDAYILRGRERMQSGNLDQAIADFKTAMEFPANLEGSRDSKINIANYYIGLSLKAQGDREGALDHFRKLADFEPASRSWGAGYWPELKYYRALAYRELGREEMANTLARQLLEEGRTQEKFIPHPAADLRSVIRRYEVIQTKASGKYCLALANLLLNKTSTAVTYFKETLKLDPAHVGANNYFSSGQ